MEDDRSVLRRAIGWHEDGEQLALATVVSTWGSSPRPAGSHMVVRSDGRFVGSVSGGCIERQVVLSALAAIDDGACRTEEFGLSAWRNGLSCGGKIAVLVQPLAEVAALKQVLAEVEAGRPAGVSLGLSDGQIAFHPASAWPAPIEGRFLRLYRPPPKLVIAGAVHIAESLSQMAAIAGFQPVVFDPRREFAERDTFGEAPFVGWPEQYFARTPLDAASAVVSLTHVVKIDHPTMIAALRSPSFYIGALGNRLTHGKRLARLQGEGFTPSDLERIHGPVGLPIGARSPAEIAVAILAEVIQCWRQHGVKAGLSAA